MRGTPFTSDITGGPLGVTRTLSPSACTFTMPMEQRGGSAHCVYGAKTQPNGGGPGGRGGVTVTRLGEDSAEGFAKAYASLGSQRSVLGPQYFPKSFSAAWAAPVPRSSVAAPARSILRMRGTQKLSGQSSKICSSLPCAPSRGRVSERCELQRSKVDVVQIWHRRLP